MKFTGTFFFVKLYPDFFLAAPFKRDVKLEIVAETQALLCSVQFMWKEALCAGHAFCVMEDISHLHHNIHNAQSFVSPPIHLPSSQSINPFISQIIFTQTHDRQTQKLLVYNCVCVVLYMNCTIQRVLPLSFEYKWICIFLNFTFLNKESTKRLTPRCQWNNRRNVSLSLTCSQMLQFEALGIEDTNYTSIIIFYKLLLLVLL